MCNRKFWLSWRALAAFAACTIFAFAETSLAAPLRAQVAQVAADGTVKVFKERLVDHFANGQPVADAYVDVSNGFLRLVRKGFKPNGDCLREVATLVDANGLSVVPSALVKGQVLWVFDATPVSTLGCTDNGCHALKNVVPIGEPPLVYARCDTSDGTCQCHINDGTGDSTVGGGFCSSWYDKSVLSIDQWVLHQFIE